MAFLAEDGGATTPRDVLETARQVRAMPARERRARERSVEQLQSLPRQDRLRMIARAHAARKTVASRVREYCEASTTATTADVDRKTSQIMAEVVAQERARLRQRPDHPAAGPALEDPPNQTAQQPPPQAQAQAQAQPEPQAQHQPQPRRGAKSARRRRLGGGALRGPPHMSDRAPPEPAATALTTAEMEEMAAAAADEDNMGPSATAAPPTAASAGSDGGQRRRSWLSGVVPKPRRK